MKKLFFLSIVCFLLTGCYGSKNNTYPQNNLRAPVSASSAAAVPERKMSDMPQSITQPSVTAVPQPQVIQPQQQPQAVQPQQPLVQTIVIPQYAPQMGYGSMPVPNMPVSGVVDMNGFTMPNVPAPYGGAVPPVANPVPAAPAINVPPVPTQVANAAPAINTPPVPVQSLASNKKESVYPSWASADYTPPAGYNVSDAMVNLKHPQYNEIVQCAAVDVMCINSYKQQGYQPATDDNGFAQKQDAGYPRTPARESESNNIPRW